MYCYEEEVESLIATQKKSDIFGTYVRNMMYFFACEKLCQRTYTPCQQTKLVLKNLLPKYQDHFRIEIQQYHPPLQKDLPLPFSMEIQNLATTLSTWTDALPNTTCQAPQHTVGIVHQLTETEYTQYDDDVAHNYLVWGEMCHAIRDGKTL